jgi:hypothetical protein
MFLRSSRVTSFVRVCRWRSFMQVLNVSSFLKCLHNTDIPKGGLNFLANRNELKKVGIYLGLPGLFDDDFEYIVRRSKFMVVQSLIPQPTTFYLVQLVLQTRLLAYSCYM